MRAFILTALSACFGSVLSYTSGSDLLDGYTFLEETKDTFDVPEWLQNIPSSSKVAKYRMRRFLVPSSAIDLKFTLTLPGEKVFGLPLKAVALRTILQFVVPSNFVVQLDGLDGVSFVQGRNYANRTHLYDKVESLLSGWGLNGRACMLRTLCEISEIPFRQGLVGEIINFVFKVSENPTAIESNSIDDTEVYHEARHHGKLLGNCPDKYPKCPFSILKGISKLAFS